MHLHVDAAGQILSAGPTLRRLVGDAATFEAAFEVVGQTPTGPLLRLAHAERVFLRTRTQPAQILRGRAIGLPDGGLVLNLGLGIGLVEAIRGFDLTDRDFAPADLAMEFLFLHEANSAMTQELSRANRRLEDARSRAEAEAYAKSKGLDYIVTEPKPRAPNVRPRGYGENFATDRRLPWTH